MPSAQRLRILGLLAVLAASVLYAGQQHIYSRSWRASLPVVIYAIAGDDREETRRYIRTLDTGRFSDVDRWMEREAARYEVPQLRPTSTSFGGEIDDGPPAYDGGGPLETLIWGLRMRLWAALNTPDGESNVHRVRIFVLYYSDPQVQLPHSLGLQKGLIGVVHAYAIPTQNRQNNIVIAHELLHTVGATDKYDVQGAPIYPTGYAEPWRNPLFPQPAAEIMAGRLPLSLYKSEMPPGLRNMVIGPITAREINWLQ